MNIFSKYAQCFLNAGVIALGGLTITQSDDSSTNMVIQMLLLKQKTTFTVGTSNNLNLPRNNSLTTQEIVSRFKENGMPIAVIADIANVERKSVYAWLNGGAVKPQNQSRLEAVYIILTEEKQADFRNLYRFWNKEIHEGITLATLLKEENLNNESIRMALKQLWPLAKKQQQLAESRIKNDDINSNPFLRDTREANIVI